MATDRAPGPHPTRVLAGRRLDHEGVCDYGTTFAWCIHPACDWYREGAREHVRTAATDHEGATSLMDLLDTITPPPAPPVRLDLFRERPRATRLRDDRMLAIGWTWTCTEPGCGTVIEHLDDPEGESARMLVEALADQHLDDERLRS